MSPLGGWNIRDLHHGSHAKELIGKYIDDRTCSGKRRAAPFDKTRGSIDEKVVGITRQRYEYLAHTEGALICRDCTSPIASQFHHEALRSGNETNAPDIDEPTNTINPNSKVRKSGAVGKAVLAQDPGFDGKKSCFF